MGAPVSCLSGTACDLEPNSGCSGTNVCAYAFESVRTNECIAPGTGALGTACDANTDCASGFSCLFGFCTELCCPDTGSCTASTTCGTVDVMGTDFTDTLHVCLCDVGGSSCPPDHFCNPIGTGTRGTCLAQGACSRLMQDCPSGQGCYGSIRECAPPGTAAIGEACTNHPDCVPGAWCRGSGGSGQCASYCEVGGTDVCPAGFVCTSFGDDEPDVGGCYPM